MATTKKRASLPPAGLALAETVLATLKSCARRTELWHDSAVNTNEMLGPGVALADLVLDRDCKRGETYRRFLEKHWLAASGAKADATAFFVAREAEPRYLTLRTFARLDYLECLATFARALDGMPIELSEDRSWTWDEAVRTSKDRPLHRTAYLLHISLAATEPFDAEQWLKTAGEDLCVSSDERADRCLLQLAEEADIDYGSMLGYERTKSGLAVECENEKVAERIRASLFSDCTAAISKGRTRHDPTVLRVTLP